MVTRLSFFAIVFSILVNFAYAASEVSLTKKANRFVVRVIATESNLFEPSNSTGHGSGFITSLTKTKGTVFTNAHVVAHDPLSAQEVALEFVVEGQTKPETVIGKLVYKSPVTDFAVVEFDPRKIKRASIATADLAKTSAVTALTKPGRKVMAFGHPHEGRNISTFGAITGEDINDDERYLQTDAPINPGNSGGPLIELESGKVIGMNTAVREESDGTGYSIPIDTVLHDYEEWKTSKKAGERKILANFFRAEEGELTRQKTWEKLDKYVEGWTDKYSGVIAVNDAAESTGLRPGDIILKANGEVFGDREFALSRICQWSKSNEVQLTVFREGKLIEVSTPITDIGASKERKKTDFVMISGVVFQDTDPLVTWSLGRDKSSVKVTKILNSTAGMEFANIFEGSLIVQVQVEGKTYPIKRLADLREVALRLQEKKEPILLTLHEPVTVSTPDGREPFKDPVTGEPTLKPNLRVETLTVDSVVLPEQLNLSKMRKGFNFDGTNPETRDWRHWCDKALK